ncbi:MAG: UbiA family prenyltransferase [Bacteroidia bacterium]
MSLTRTAAFRHLRLPFSWFLMPAFLLGWLATPQVSPGNLLLLFGILHLLVYPSSNAYNSHQDQDEGPIGGMEHPPKPPESLRYISLGMDVLALALGIWLHWGAALGLLAYILASRAYSHRALRLKKYPLAGFFTVVIFQGPWIMALVAVFGRADFAWSNVWQPGWLYLASALMLAGTYPLTQIYQHEADKRDGVLSLSAWLGIMGTFRFSALAFLLAGPALLIPLYLQNRVALLLLLSLALLPVLGWFVYWWRACARDVAAVNYKNTMRMNMLASTLLNIALLLACILNL